VRGGMALPSRAGRSPETGLSQLAHVEVATVKRVIEETSRVETIMLDASGWPGSSAGTTSAFGSPIRGVSERAGILDCLSPRGSPATRSIERFPGRRGLPVLGRTPRSRDWGAAPARRGTFHLARRRRRSHGWRSSADLDWHRGWRCCAIEPVRSSTVHRRCHCCCRRALRQTCRTTTTCGPGRRRSGAGYQPGAIRTQDIASAVG
jgi:hypothetical protein